jgi:hypothetical protein
MPEGLQRAWSRSGYQDSLENRFAAAVARLQKLSPGNGLCGQPRSETALDTITDEIARLTRPPPGPDADQFYRCCVSIRIWPADTMLVG